MKVVFGDRYNTFCTHQQQNRTYTEQQQEIYHTAVLNPVCSVAELPVNKSFHQRPAYSCTRSHCHVNLFTSFNVVIFDL